MKATKYGNRYQITYRCPGFPRIINEYFDTLEEAELRISCIKLEKKRGTLTPPAEYLERPGPAPGEDDRVHADAGIPDHVRAEPLVGKHPLL